MSIASANEDHNHVISVRTYRNLQEAVGRVVHMDIGRCDVIGFERLFSGFLFLFYFSRTIVLTSERVIVPFN